MRAHPRILKQATGKVRERAIGVRACNLLPLTIPPACPTTYLTIPPSRTAWRPLPSPEAGNAKSEQTRFPFHWTERGKLARREGFARRLQTTAA